MEYIGIINISSLAFSISMLLFGYLIGYTKGFRKSREIDDKIIDNIVKKYKSEDK